MFYKLKKTSTFAVFQVLRPVCDKNGIPQLLYWITDISEQTEYIYT